MTRQSVDDRGGKIRRPFDELSNRQLELALSTAALCSQSWRGTTFAGRAAVVAKAAAIMHARVDDFAVPLALETGTLIDQARGEVVLCADIFAYYANNAERILAARRRKSNSVKAETENTSVGVLLGVEPWNFPYYQLTRFAAPNLMAGNVLMVKHARSVRQCASVFETLWLIAGAPAGVFTNLLISHDQLNKVIEDPRINGVALTGGADAREVLARIADETHKNSSIERRDSSAYSTRKDADHDKAIQRTVWDDMPGYYGPRIS